MGDSRKCCILVAAQFAASSRSPQVSLLGWMGRAIALNSTQPKRASSQFDIFAIGAYNRSLGEQIVNPLGSQEPRMPHQVNCQDRFYWVMPAVLCAGRIVVVGQPDSGRTENTGSVIHGGKTIGKPVRSRNAVVVEHRQ